MADIHILISIFHIFIVVPFFLYIGLQRNALDDFVYDICLGLGIVLLLYHAYRSYVRILASSPNAWRNLLHVLIVAPILLYLGRKRKDAHRAGYDMLLLVAFGALGFHLYSLIELTNLIRAD